MRFWSELSPRSQAAVRVFSLTSILTLLLCLTPYYSQAEFRFYDYRLQTWDKFVDFTNPEVQLVSVRDTTLNSGFPVL